MLTCMPTYTYGLPGPTTRYASDAEDHQMFSYSEQVVANLDIARAITMMFTDNKGIEFVTATYDLSGSNIRSGSTSLGVFASRYRHTPLPYTALGRNWAFCGAQTLTVNITGGGTVTMKKVKVSCWGCCFFACCCRGSYEILVNGEKVGSWGRDGEGDAPLVTFSPTLDPRLKGIIIVLSFILFNIHY
ncbi:uncharacterized protein LOC118433669 [Folsomia candida]|uniref:uncharacterized protein LOC118433669 n=1 Tax=Folsomia candida TaxID=158441 RepID=UPI001604F113|nr:uncharacterized protein LOC118433669 [Folsomia candida]